MERTIAVYYSCNISFGFRFKAFVIKSVQVYHFSITFGRISIRLVKILSYALRISLEEQDIGYARIA